MLAAGRPEKLCKMYKCKIISRQRGNFQVLGPENNQFANFEPMLTAGRPEKLGKMYLCKIISRQRGNFLVLGPENQPFCQPSTNVECWETREKLTKIYLCKIISR